VICYFDSHCHLADDQLWPEVDQVLERARRVGVTSWMSICTNRKTLQRNLELSQRIGTESLYLAAAVHPQDVHTELEEGYSAVEQAVAAHQISAIGETGLDYLYATDETRPIQHHYLERFSELALLHNLPLIIHCRDAFVPLAEALKSYAARCTHIPGVIHCFTGSWEEASHWLDAGWMISFSGIVTFKKSDALRQVALQMPLDRLLIETDAPYLAPQAYRGKRCEPAYVVETAATIGSLRNMLPSALGEVAFQNTLRMLRIV
jgi:TatD DNase family protein